MLTARATVIGVFLSKEGLFIFEILKLKYKSDYLISAGQSLQAENCVKKYQTSAKKH